MSEIYSRRTLRDHKLDDQRPFHSQVLFPQYTTPARLEKARFQLFSVDIDESLPLDRHDNNQGSKFRAKGSLSTQAQIDEPNSQNSNDSKLESMENPVGESYISISNLWKSGYCDINEEQIRSMNPVTQQKGKPSEMRKNIASFVIVEAMEQQAKTTFCCGFC